MDEHGGFGDGGLHVVHGGDHLRGDGEVLLGLGEGVRQGADDMGEAGKEPPVKVHHAEQPLDVELGGGEGQLLDGIDLLREGANPLGVQGVTQEGHSGLGQHTLLEVDGEAVLPESGEHLPQVLLVFLQGPRTY